MTAPPSSALSPEDWQTLHTWGWEGPLDVAAKDSVGYSALDYLIIHWPQHTSEPPYPLVERLLTAGSDPVCDDGTGYTLLHRAMFCGTLDARLLEQLVDAGADPAAADTDGYTVLMAAIRHSTVALVETLLARGASLDAVMADTVSDSAQETEGFTALHWAANTIADVTDILACLVAHGADVQATDSYGRGILHGAGGVNLRWLLTHTDASLETVDHQGRTSLMACIHAADVQTLLQAGADLQARNPIQGGTALTHAVLDGHPDVVDVLLQAGADFNHQDSQGRHIWDLSTWTTAMQEILNRAQAARSHEQMSHLDLVVGNDRQVHSRPRF